MNFKQKKEVRTFMKKWLTGGPANPAGPGGPASPRSPWRRRGVRRVSQGFQDCSWQTNRQVLTGAPRAPEGPTGPAAPGSPLSPVAPAGPGSPIGPVKPRGPSLPGAPSAPLSPWSPWVIGWKAGVRNTRGDHISDLAILRAFCRWHHSWLIITVNKTM